MRYRSSHLVRNISSHLARKPTIALGAVLTIALGAQDTIALGAQDTIARGAEIEHRTWCGTDHRTWRGNRPSHLVRYRSSHLVRNIPSHVVRKPNIALGAKNRISHLAAATLVLSKCEGVGPTGKTLRAIGLQKPVATKPPSNLSPTCPQNTTRDNEQMTRITTRSIQAEL